eukprot:722645-Prorocentrum_minimum.AAC.3
MISNYCPSIAHIRRFHALLNPGRSTSAITRGLRPSTQLSWGWNSVSSTQRSVFKASKTSTTSARSKSLITMATRTPGQPPKVDSRWRWRS